MPEAIDTVKRAQGPIERVFPPMVRLPPWTHHLFWH